ncbi:electron transport complex subunit RsxC [Vibrio hannami]|uniref:electron transport complex subunit RsxC n=1 Tax=Vibrio hannami TaxID=2717094 RepID=UPI00240FB218|nr:electron transport complex subunit RsxC [Vibrio hannami]MDG3085040.1 electron transport complex subunit RsxC [Vibrio hannami]
MRSIFNAPFSGGIHPKTYKSMSNNGGIAKDFWPKNVYLPLQLRNGALLQSLVKPGDHVKRGQKIAVGKTPMIAPMHSPVNGIVTAITKHITAHPSKVKCDTIIIRANQDKSWVTETTKGNFYRFSSEEIINKIEEAGIVGLGGAGFPTASKLKFARQAKVHTLVINGGECEPYLTCDDLTMREAASEVVAGIRLMLKASGAERAIVGVEDNKAEAFEQLSSLASDDENIEVMSVPSIYPMGSERHLVKAVTGVTVPLGKLSTSIGILVNNIATAQAVYNAVRFNRPLVSRVITVSGKGITKPGNIEVPVGTPVHEILTYCDGFSEDTERLIFGGPMMGQVILSPQIPVDKCVGGILALTADEVKERPHQDCIRCGQCVRACPMGLMPFQMASYSRMSDFKMTEKLGVNFCLSCGACSYVCPSSIPLVQYFQHAKGAINANKMKEKRSAQAKALTEARTIRLAKEAEAKRAAKAAKAAGRKKRAPRASAKKKEEVMND